MDIKRRYIISATRMLELLTVKYPKAETTQELRFPVDSSNATDKHGELIGDGFDQMKEACIKQAFYLSENWEVINEARGFKTSGIKTEKIGPKSTTVSGYNPSGGYDPAVLTLLAPYLDMTCGAVRV